MFADRDFPAEGRLAVKMALASSLGWCLATLAGAHRPIFGALVGLVALSGDPYQALNVSAARVVGVFAGVAIGLGLLQLDLRLLWLVVLALLCGSLAGIPLRVGDRPNIQVAVSALFLVGVSQAGALQAGVARLWETALGAGVTVLVAALVWPPDPARELRRRLERLRQALAADLAAVAEELGVGGGAVEERMDDVRSHSLEAVRELFELDQAGRALRLNPLRRRDRPVVEELGRRVGLAARLHRHARSIARDVADARVVSPALAAATRAVAEAADLALRGADVGAALDAAEGRVGAVDARDGQVFLLRAQLGQLLADLRRAAVG